MARVIAVFPAIKGGGLMPQKGRVLAREPEPNSRNWQEWEDSNPRPAVLES